MAEKITLSVIKADVGGYVGHSSIHQNLLDAAQEKLSKAKDSGLIVDFHVTRVGDDLELIMTHERGIDNEEIHQLAWETFLTATEAAQKLKLYGAGQDILSDAFSG
ncbi:MAG: fructose 1,6-bisphosphatase, partial [Nitrospirae bacterium]